MAKKRKLGSFAEDMIILAIVGVGGFLLYKWISGGLGGFFTSGATQPGLRISETTTAAGQSAAQTMSTQAAVPASTNPFFPTLYEKTPTDASIDQATANNLWADVQANVTNYNDPDSLPYGSSNFSAVSSAFQSVVGNQTDVSWVAYICELNSGKDLLSYINDNYTSGDALVVQTFINWVNGLPVN